MALSAAQIAQARAYIKILLLWNERVGLTTVSAPEEILARHFGESLYVTRFAVFESGRLADIGTGAGFPGLAIKILYPEIDLFLVESNNKKAAFLAEAARTLALTHISIVAERYEDWRVPPHSLDFVVSRALGHYPFLLRWALETLKPTGKLVLWLGDDESTRLQTRSGWRWAVPERIPQSHHRQILLGSPAAPSTK